MVYADKASAVECPEYCSLIDVADPVTLPNLIGIVHIASDAEWYYDSSRDGSL